MSTPEVVCLDLAGTTVVDAGVVEQAFQLTLDAMGIRPDDPRRPGMEAFVRSTMGTSKIEVFRTLFGDEDEAQRANAAFERSYADLLDRGGAHPVPGATELMARLRAEGVRVALTTGFSPATRDLLLDRLGWGAVADLVLSPADAGRGRPFPDMVLVALLRLEAPDVWSVAVVGDTAADMESGRRAGAGWVVGVLTGSDERARLEAAGATHVVASVAALAEPFGLG